MGVRRLFEVVSYSTVYLSCWFRNHPLSRSIKNNSMLVDFRGWMASRSNYSRRFMTASQPQISIETCLF
ncbi:hypothetical protein Leryth_027000 [Lithospermum erythrorhizon]|nr:hypothetical protein Leryth_027000 [Lithospermum erythrorhizon]